MKKYFTFCIWNYGPGRPFDNEYMLVSESYKEDTIVLSFDNGEKCVIMNPINIIKTETCLKIEKASKILWNSFYYGKSKNDDTLITIQYELLENDQIQIIENGPFKNHQIISANNSIAFEAYIRTEK